MFAYSEGSGEIAAMPTVTLASAFPVHTAIALQISCPSWYSKGWYWSHNCFLLKDMSWGLQPQGGTLIFSYIRRLGPFFWVQKFEFQYFWGFSEKLIFLGVWRFCGYFFGVITKLDYIKRSFLCILGSFLKVKVQNGGGGYFLGLLKIQIFF